MGESLTIVSTVFWTLHITYTDMATEYVDSISMMCIQLGVVTFLSCLAALLLEVYLVSPLVLPSSLLSSPPSLYYFLFTYLLSFLLTCLLSSPLFPSLLSHLLHCQPQQWFWDHIFLFLPWLIFLAISEGACPHSLDLTCLDLLQLLMCRTIRNPYVEDNEWHPIVIAEAWPDVVLCYARDCYHFIVWTIALHHIFFSLIFSIFSWLIHSSSHLLY